MERACLTKTIDRKAIEKLKCTFKCKGRFKNNKVNGSQNVLSLILTRFATVTSKQLFI